MICDTLSCAVCNSCLLFTSIYVVFYREYKKKTENLATQWIYLLLIAKFISNCTHWTWAILFLQLFPLPFSRNHAKMYIFLLSSHFHFFHTSLAAFQFYSSTMKRYCRLRKSFTISILSPVFSNNIFMCSWNSTSNSNKKWKLPFLWSASR